MERPLAHIRPRRRIALLCALAVWVPACAARWTPRTARSDIALQWPYQPNPAKLTHLQSIAGFARGRDVGSVLRTVVIGGRDTDDSFLLPAAVAVGADGRLAVADTGRRAVHLYVPGAQRYERISGSAGETMVSPVGVVFDDRLRLYISDSAGAVFVFGVDGASLFTLRQAGAEPLRRPSGLAYSPQTKRLYVVDTLADKVHVFEQDGRFAFSFGGRGEAVGRFNHPTHIFRSAAGELYVADSLNFRIEIFDEDGHVKGAFGHHGDGSGDLAMPKGVAVDRDGTVYVVDGMFDHVQLFTRKGQFLLTLGQRGVDFGEFWLPAGAFISENDELYVCDTYNRRIQVFRITGRYEGDER